MKLYIATDHGALEAKNELRDYLLKSGYEVEDLGTHSNESCHYPEYASKLAKEVVNNNCMGVLLCGSGIGVSVVANKFTGVTAALCRTEDDARLAREHNNANVICFGGRVSTIEEMKKMIFVFLSTAFEGGRHEIRTKMFEKLGTSVNEF